MEEALTSWLLEDDGIASLVGSRITWVARPQASGLPAIALTRIDGAPVNSDDGADALTESRVQVDCWALTYAAAKGAARAVISRVSGIEIVHGGVDFQGVYIDGEADTFDSGSNVGTGTAERLYRTRLDLIIWHKEI